MNESSEHEVPHAVFGAAFLICLKELIYFRQISCLYCLGADHTNERSILHRSLIYMQACITCRPIIETALHYMQACITCRPIIETALHYMQACITCRPIIETALHYIHVCITCRPIIETALHYTQPVVKEGLCYIIINYSSLFFEFSGQSTTTRRESNQRLIEYRTDTTQPRRSFSILLYIRQS
jgi:hypothetical protein